MQANKTLILNINGTAQTLSMLQDNERTGLMYGNKQVTLIVRRERIEPMKPLQVTINGKEYEAL